MQKTRLEELEKNLTNKQKSFCKEYLFDWNATRAYKKIYDNIKNDNSAAAASSRMLRLVKIKEYIDEIQKDLSKLSGITPLSQITELKKLAYGNAANLRSGWMGLKDFDSLTEDERACIREVTTTRTSFIKGVEKEEVKIKIHNKESALREINKMLGYYAIEKKEVTVISEQPLFAPIKED